MSWQWQLQGAIDVNVDADAFDIDMDQSANVVADLHARGKKVICYVNVAGKAVFEAEYSLDTSRFCWLATDMGVSAIQKRSSLDSWRAPCTWPDSPAAIVSG